MKEAMTVTATAELISANGGVEFARGYIDGIHESFSMPSLQHNPDYSRGFISSCDIPALLWLASRGVRNGGSDWWSGLPSIEIRNELLKHID